jgi:hypothetical protein
MIGGFYAFLLSVSGTASRRRGSSKMILMAMLVAAMCVMLIAPWPVSKAD